MGFGPQDAPAPRSYVGTPDDIWNRQYGQVPPVLAASNIPKVLSTTGGVAASCQVDMSNGGMGRVFVYPGANPLASGQVILAFPSTPPTLFVAGDDGFGFANVGQTVNVNNVTLFWSTANFIKNRSQPYVIGFQWATSR